MSDWREEDRIVKKRAQRVMLLDLRIAKLEDTIESLGHRERIGGGGWRSGIGPICAGSRGD